MTLSDASISTNGDPPYPSDGQAVRNSSRWQRGEQLLERISERLNPILVKEARQALKSRQFALTFMLLLIFGWAWSVLGVSLLAPSIYYAPRGIIMLTGYFLVLGVPLLIIVPFSAFRSLAVEREDGTYELLSVTALSARQVVTGKLGSAVLQMLVYYSALSPCITFTYLLRGIDIISIMLLLSYTFLASLILSIVGLLLATVSRVKHWQVLLSVAFIVGLLFAGFWYVVTVFTLLPSGETLPVNEPGFWTVHVGALSVYASYAALLVTAAAAQLSFASDNRSTRLRVIMLVQQMLLVGWMAGIWLLAQEEGVLYAMASLATAHWYLMGTLLSGELAQLSPRVKRKLPQSFLGRTLFTWFNPGSGTGYVFAVTNLISVQVLIAFCAVGARVEAFAGAPVGNELFWLQLMMTSYVAAYLGFGRLIFLALRRYTPSGLMLSVLCQGLLLALGAILPLIFNSLLLGRSQLEYNVFQATNWIWTLNELAYLGDVWANTGSIFGVPDVIVLVVGFALVMLLVNLILAAREVEHVRLATPSRVQLDESEIKPRASVLRGLVWEGDE